MSKVVCEKCRKTIDGVTYSIGGINYCWVCSRIIYKENLEKSYPTPEKKLMGIIEHLDTLNNNLEKQEKHLLSMDNNIGCIKTFLIITFILGVIIGFITAISY